MLNRRQWEIRNNTTITPSLLPRLIFLNKLSKLTFWVYLLNIDKRNFLDDNVWYGIEFRSSGLGGTGPYPNHPKSGFNRISFKTFVNKFQILKTIKIDELFIEINILMVFTNCKNESMQYNRNYNKFEND